MRRLDDIVLYRSLSRWLKNNKEIRNTVHEVIIALSSCLTIIQTTSVDETYRIDALPLTPIPKEGIIYSLEDGC